MSSVRAAALSEPQSLPARNTLSLRDFQDATIPLICKN
jgi:hypothetical protein